MIIFWFDQGEIEGALATAVSRGVDVHRLIARTPTVARTADAFDRCHGELMLVDHRDSTVLKAALGAAWHY